MDTHYTDMKGKPCPLIPGDNEICLAGYCPDCFWYDGVQKERARELVKEIENLTEDKYQAKGGV